MIFDLKILLDVVVTSVVVVGIIVCVIEIDAAVDVVVDVVNVDVALRVPPNDQIGLPGDAGD